jgi:hypothetical protein
MKAAFIFALLACSALADPFAQRIRCDINDDQEAAAKLKTMRWIQGSTPLVRFDVYENGAESQATNAVQAVLIFGASANATNYVCVTNSGTAGNGYLVQLPTVGTNSAGSAWWYTVYFQRGGYRYWTGSGDLYIEATTSTAEDGLVWQPITGAAALTAHNTNGAAHADIRAMATNTTDQTARTDATNALAQALTALSVALSKASPADASNIVAAFVSSWAPTGSVSHATTAGGIEIDNGNLRFTLAGDVFTVIKTTNTTSVIVTETNGVGYNGPAKGLIWTGPPSFNENIFIWPMVDYAVLQQGSEFFEFDGPLDVDVSDGVVANHGWTGVAGGWFAPKYGPSYGTMKLDWKTHTTTNIYNLASFMTNGQPHTVTFTNLTTMADGKLGGTNGVYWTRNSTNYWVLLP